MEHAVLMMLMDVYRRADAEAGRYLEVEILETPAHREITKALQRSFDEFEGLVERHSSTSTSSSGPRTRTCRIHR